MTLAILLLENNTMIKLFFDGSCEPVNPGGTAAWGYVIKDENDKTLFSGSGIVGKGTGMTNNVAEYAGLIAGLTAVKKHNLMDSVNERLIVYGDSQMVINMVNKTWGWKKTRWIPHLKAPHLKDLLLHCLGILQESDGRYALAWIPREENAEADELSKALSY